LLASNAAEISALSKINLTLIAHAPIESLGSYETDEKAVDQTDAENRADFF